METVENMILVLGSAISKGEGTGIYIYLGLENKYRIFPDIFHKNIYMVSNQKELKSFNITTKNIVQVLLKFINDGHKTNIKD